MDFKRKKHLIKLKEGNESEIVALEVGLEVGKNKIKEAAKKEAEAIKALETTPKGDKTLSQKQKNKTAAEELKWAIEKKIAHMEEQKKDFSEALVIINKQINEIKE